MTTRMLRVAVVVVCAAALVGCDRACDIVVYNSSDREVWLYTGLCEVGLSVRAGTVRIFTALDIPWRGPVAVRVTDSSGGQLYEASLEPELGPRGLPQIDVCVPVQTWSACPPSLHEKYLVVVENKTSEQMTIMVDEEQLGAIQPLSAQTFGPLEGELTSVLPTRVVDSDGQMVPWYAEVEYLLTDELPEFRIVVDRRPWAK
jgi:hypothetical protein